MISSQKHKRVKNLKKPYRRENCAVVASTNGAKINFGSRSCKTNRRKTVKIFTTYFEKK